MGKGNMVPTGYYLYTEPIKMVLIDHEQTKSVMMVAVAGVFQEFGMLLRNLSYMASFLFYFLLGARWPLHLQKVLLR